VSSPVRFLPWARQGLAVSLDTKDPGGGAPLPARAELRVNAVVSGGPGGTATTTVRVLGPADVTAIDPRQVLRVEPAPRTSNFEPNYLPLVEFDRPDFPWLFTPAAAGSADQLRPWLCLVVVERDAEATLETPSDHLAVLKLKDAGTALPNLGESWAWAHAQVAGSGSPAVILRSSDASRTLSRLLCPRRLREKTAYIAAVVPAFEQGRLAGLGRLPASVDSAAQLLPAWTATTAALDLPAYCHWEFTTGVEGDFEALFSRLQRVSLTADQVGRRPMRVRDLPAGLPDLGDVAFFGALGVPGDEDKLAESSFHAALRALLNTPLPGPPGRAPAGLPLPPPLYGRWQAARATIPPAGGPLWLRQLNLHPANRAAAGIGTELVIDQQETLMAGAWAQVQEILLANQILRQAQLARSAASSLHADLVRVAQQAPALLVSITGPVATRIRHGTGTVAATIAASRVPAAMVGPAFRRALRPRGPVTRRRGTVPHQVLDKVNTGTVDVITEWTPPPGTVLFEVVHEGVRLCELDRRFVANVPLPRPNSSLRPPFEAFQTAAAVVQDTLPPCVRRPPVTPPPLDVPGLAVAICGGLDPETAVPTRVGGRITPPPGWSPDDLLEPVMVAPQFPTPMYRALTARSQDLLLPGVGEVPPNSVAALSTNPRFIEAFMVGLNHEMSRELLWRRFPTDQRGTYFQQFWDPAGRLPAPATQEERVDHPPIHEWDPALELGGHCRGGRQFVLLIRGDLLRRFPDTAIYLARGEWFDAADGQRRRRPVIAPSGLPPVDPKYPERYPAFTGTLEPDITFRGFLVPPADAVGSPDPAANRPGWFVVFQQQATALRSGIDATAPAPPGLTGTWRDLWWGNVPRTPSQHVDLSQPLTGIVVTAPAGLRWAATSTSAELAAILTQQPFRAAIHASDLLPPS
jgi:hypothetical protein